MCSFKSVGVKFKLKCKSPLLWPYASQLLSIFIFINLYQCLDLASFANTCHQNYVMAKQYNMIKLNACHHNQLVSTRNEPPIHSFCHWFPIGFKQERVLWQFSEICKCNPFDTLPCNLSSACIKFILSLRRLLTSLGLHQANTFLYIYIF